MFIAMFILMFIAMVKRIRFFIALLSAMMSLSSACAVTPESASEPRGALVIAGGAMRPDNAAVWERFVALAGGRGARIAIIPSGSANPMTTGQFVIDTLRRYGAEGFIVPLSVRLPQTPHRQISHDPEWIARVESAGGIYMSGGNQNNITEVLFDEAGQRTPMLEAMWKVYQRGGVIGGSSAGAAVMSESMISAGTGPLGALSVGVSDPKTIAAGLGFIGPGVFIDQHLIIRGRFARMLPAMQQAGVPLGLGIDENTAMIVTPGGNVEIVGYKGAILIDLAQAKNDASLADYNISNVRISYLDRGDRYNFRTRLFTPSAVKAKSPVNPNKPFLGRQPMHTNILANTVVVEVMQHLIDSAQDSTIGLAFAGPDGREPQKGWEFKLSKVAESRGWFSAADGAEDYSVMDLRLDVRPIRMSEPLFSTRP